MWARLMGVYIFGRLVHCIRGWVLVPRVYERSSGGQLTLIVVAMPTLPHLLEVVCE